MLKAGVAVVERNAAIESVADLHFGSGEAVTAGLRMDLQPPAVPLHDVIVADDAFVREAADAFESFRRWPPGFSGVAGCAGETAIVIDDETTQHGVGAVQIACGR